MNKKGGVLALITGVALGAAAWFFSDEKNRESAKKVASKGTQTVKKTAASAAKAVKKVATKAKKTVAAAKKKKK